MKIKVDYDLCEANAICMRESPKVFEVDDDDNLLVLIEEPGEELHASVREAARLCPRQALKLKD
jgi:ferredoxin